MASYAVRINGLFRTVDSSDPDQPLLYVLRSLGLTATKFGCGLGQCGACTVLVDGRATQSCLAFIKEQALQCGYCTSGMIMSAVALLTEKPKPTEEDVRSALNGHLCRCGTHIRVVRAVMAASGQGG